jgi:hypothetical protein
VSLSIGYIVIHIYRICDISVGQEGKHLFLVNFVGFRDSKKIVRKRKKVDENNR